VRPFSDDLLAQATRLLSAKLPQEILALTCRAVQRLAEVDLLFGSFGTTATWATGVHQRFCGSEWADVGSAQRSALFGVHRAVSRQRGPVMLGRATAATIVDTLRDPDDPSGQVLAIPIVHPRGRLCGCLALCVRSPLSDAATAVVVELASLAALALDNVQRISAARRDRERLSLLAEAAEEAHWDWSPITGEFWWGGGTRFTNPEPGMGNIALE
jgi:GAF domain-containing protein